MKPKIHPQYQEADVVCACGNKFKIGSAKAELHVEICSACHPLYTGKEKIMDSAGRVEKFKRRSVKARKSSKK